MFKKSIYIVAIQVIGIVLGVLSIYLVAGDMAPEVYSIIGVYQTVVNLSGVFAGWGVESIVCREALYWNQQGNGEKVTEYSTQAMLSKLVSCIVIFPIMLIYLFYMNAVKYNGEYMFLFFCMAMGAVANLLIDSMRNLVRADGGYVFVQLMGTINATFLKLIGIAIYFRFGVMPYLYFYIFASVPILVCFIIRCKQYFSVKYLQLTPMFRKIWDARYLWLKSDLEYIRANADSLLISLLFPAAIMGTYTVYKSIEQIMKNFIEGFFDVLSQNTVCYKGDRIALENQEHKIKIIRNLVVIVIILGTIIYAANMSWWTRLINLQHYEGIDIFILCVALTSIIYLLGKYEINAIAFLAETKMNFKLALITAVLATMTYLVIAVMPTTTVIVIQRVLVYLFPTVVAVYLFQKNKMNIYGKINH